MACLSGSPVWLSINCPDTMFHSITYESSSVGSVFSRSRNILRVLSEYLRGSFSFSSNLFPIVNITHIKPYTLFFFKIYKMFFYRLLKIYVLILWDQKMTNVHQANTVLWCLHPGGSSRLVILILSFTDQENCLGLCLLSKPEVTDFSAKRQWLVNLAMHFTEWNRRSPEDPCRQTNKYIRSNLRV